jgi:hypothetical protein
MTVATTAVLALLAPEGIKHVSASPIPDQHNHRPCTSFTIPVPITANQHTYAFVHINSNIDASQYAADLDTWDNPFLAGACHEEHQHLQNLRHPRTAVRFTQWC